MSVISNLKRVFSRGETAKRMNVFNSVPLQDWMKQHLLEMDGFSFDVGCLYEYYMDSRLNMTVNQQISTLKNQSWTLTYPTGTAGDPEVLDFIQYVFNNLDVPDIISNILQAFYLGYTVQEIIYAVDVDDKIIIEDIIPVDRVTMNSGISNFVYGSDGALNGFKQDNYSHKTDRIIPFEKCIYYSFRGDTNTPLGIPLSYGIAKELQLRKQVLSNLELISFRYAVPMIAASIDKSFEDLNSVRNQLAQILEGKSPGLIVDKDNKVDILSDNDDHEFLHNLMDYLDRMILSACFSLSERTASRDTDSSIEFTKSLQYNYLNSIMKDINQLFNDLIQRVVDLNFHNVSIYPVFNLNPLKPKSIYGLIDILDKIGLNKGTNTFKQIISELINEYTDINPDLEDLTFDTNPISNNPTMNGTEFNVEAHREVETDV